MGWIPANAPHFHMLVSVFPSVGLIFAIGFLVTSMVTNNVKMQQVCLFVLGGLGVLTIPTWISGQLSMAATTRAGLPEDVAGPHSFLAFGAMFLLWVTAVIALWTLYRSWKSGVGPSKNMQHLTLGLSLVTLLLMAVVGEMGWEISHQ